ncbi:MAG TPA: Uma2 family endonuclease [Nakamurella sp.]
MTTMTVMPREYAEWTVDDLDRLLDDGLRYELLDGTLLVSPPPSRRHQRAVARLFATLDAACPAEFEVLVAPLDWRPDRRTSLQPDVLVLADRNLESPAEDSMLLAVEVLSPSSRRKDAIYKRSKYEDEAVPSYWIVDPDEPSITAHELRDGRYVTVGQAIGESALALDHPFPVRIVPADLTR